MGYDRDKDIARVADRWMHVVVDERGDMKFFPGVGEDGRIVLPGYNVHIRVPQHRVTFSVYSAAWLLWSCQSPGTRPRDKLSAEARQLLQGSSFSTEGKTDYEIWMEISRFYRHKQEG